MKRADAKKVSTRRRGAEIVELALTLPVLFGLVFGTVEVGYYFFVQHTVQAAARYAARKASLAGSTNTDVSSAVDSVMQAAGLTNSAGKTLYTVATTPSSIQSANSGDQIQVTVQCGWSALGVRPMQLLTPKNDSVQATVVMQKE